MLKLAVVNNTAASQAVAANYRPISLSPWFFRCSVAISSTIETPGFDAAKIGLDLTHICTMILYGLSIIRVNHQQGSECRHQERGVLGDHFQSKQNPQSLLSCGWRNIEQRQCTFMNPHVDSRRYFWGCKQNEQNLLSVENVTPVQCSIVWLPLSKNVPDNFKNCCSTHLF